MDLSRRRLTGVAALLTWGLLSAACSAGRYGSLGPPRSTQPHNTLWASARIGMTIPFSSGLADSLLGNAQELDVNGSPFPTFGTALGVRLKRFDTAVRVDAWTGGTHDGLERVRRLGSRSRVVLEARWRAVDQPWGGFFVAPAIGVQFFDHHDDVLNNAELLAGIPAGPVRPKTETFTSGFAFKIGIGLLLYPSRWATVVVDASLDGAATTIVTDNQLEIDMSEASFNLTAGVEFRIF